MVEQQSVPRVDLELSRPKLLKVVSDTLQYFLTEPITTV